MQRFITSIKRYAYISLLNVVQIKDICTSTERTGGGAINRFSEDNNWSQEFRFNYECDALRDSSDIFLSGIEANRSQTNTIDYNLPILFDDFIPGLGAVLTTDAVLPVALYAPLFDTVQSVRTVVDSAI